MKNLVVVVSVIAALMVVAAGPVYKFGIMDLSMSFALLKYGLYVAIAAVVLLVIQVIFKRQTITALSVIICVVCVVVALGVPMAMRNKASTVPPIHDITTDVNNPPQFIAIAPLRKDAPNPVTYLGEEISKQQKTAYPDLGSMTISADISSVYKAAESVIIDLGWQRIEGALPNTLEATDSTFWFGFKDDVVIRLTEQAEGTIVDVRSKSRVGQSDLGVNAERIVTFLEALKIATNSSSK